MIYSDHVKRPSLLRKLWFNIALGMAAAGAVYALDPQAAALTQLVAPFAESGGRLLISLAVGLLFLANLHMLNWLPLRLQIITVWIELLIAFLLFFHSLDLKYAFILRKVGYLVTQGAFTTVYISAISIAIAFVLALIGAIAKLSTNGFAFGIASFYTSFFRGLPLLMQIYLLYLGLPQLGFVISAVPAGIIALSLCYGAYMTEIFRAGILSIHKGQWEASRALALSPYQNMRYVILPQAMRVIVPPTGNQFIAMLKDSSLVSVLGVWELMFLARTQGQTEFRHLEMLITAALIYWLLSIILETIQARIEVYFGKSL